MNTSTYLRYLDIGLCQWNDKPILYLMHALGTDRWKIGITNNIRNRWYSVHSQSPFDITVCKICICDSRDTAKKLEYQFMQQNKNRFVKGEWFICNYVDIFELEEMIFGYEYSHYIDRDLYDYVRMKRDEQRTQETTP